MRDKRSQPLRAAVGFAGCSLPSYDRALHALRTGLDSWSGIGHVAVGMARQGYDLQLTRYDEKGWRATFYKSGFRCSRHRRPRCPRLLKRLPSPSLSAIAVPREARRG